MSEKLMKSNTLRLIAIAFFILLPITLVNKAGISISDYATDLSSSDITAYTGLTFLFCAGTAVKIVAACLLAGALSFSLMHLRGIAIARPAS